MLVQAEELLDIDEFQQEDGAEAAAACVEKPELDLNMLKADWRAGKRHLSKVSCSLLMPCCQDTGAVAPERLTDDQRQATTGKADCHGRGSHLCAGPSGRAQQARHASC